MGTFSMPGLRAVACAAAFAMMATPAMAQEHTDYARLYDNLWNAVNETYYDPHFRGADWAAQRERFRARAIASRNDAAFQAVAREMLSQIPSSHLYIIPPARVSGNASIGVQFVTIGGQEIVREVAPLSDAYRQGLRPGDRLLSAREDLRGDVGTEAELRIQTCSNRRRSVEVRRERAFWPPEHPGFRWSQIRPSADQRIGYMRIDRFDDGAAALADQAMNEFSEASAIIIDLRGNSGGNMSAMRLASYFNGGRAEPAVVLLSRPYLAALGRPVTLADIQAAPRVDGAYTDEAVFAAVMAHNGGASFWADAIADQFRGRVFVLISEETGSAAEGFGWYMREHSNAQFIGEQSAGALLSADNIDIGDGWKVAVPVHGLWGADGADWGDRPVPPHIALTPTRADLCAGRDVVLNAALAAATQP